MSLDSKEIEIVMKQNEESKDRYSNASTCSTNLTMVLPEHIIGDRYKLTRVIGKGSFGWVCFGEHIITKLQVAIKYEDDTSMDREQLENEFKFYQELGAEFSGLPKVYLLHVQTTYSALVLELLGQTLEDKLKVHQ